MNHITPTYSNRSFSLGLIGFFVLMTLSGAIWNWTGIEKSWPAATHTVIAGTWLYLIVRAIWPGDQHTRPPKPVIINAFQACAVIVAMALHYWMVFSQIAAEQSAR